MPHNVSHIYISQGDTPFTLPAAPLNAKDYTVIDWITFVTGCTAACEVGVEILDTNLVQVWQAKETIAADDITTMHCEFPGGLPFFGALTNVTGAQYVSSQASPSRNPSIALYPGTGSGTTQCTIGFHYEPFSLRR